MACYRWPTRLRLGACGNSQWLVDLLQLLGHEVFIGDAMHRRKSRRSHGLGRFVALFPDPTVHLFFRLVLSFRVRYS